MLCTFLSVTRSRAAVSLQYVYKTFPRVDCRALRYAVAWTTDFKIKRTVLRFLVHIIFGRSKLLEYFGQIIQRGVEFIRDI